MVQWNSIIVLLMFSGLTNAWNTTNANSRSNKRIVNTAADCKSCSCGIGNTNRIVGGTKSDVDKYPWVAMLFSGGYFTCGGSLVTNQYVMTAGHCVNPSRTSKYEIRLLQNQLDATTSDTISRKVAKVTVHPKYNSVSLDNDIALLKLNEPIQFNEKIRPVCLPTGSSSYSGQMGIVIGWGALKDNGRVSNELQEASVPIITTKQCRSYGLRITSNMICAGRQQGGKDSCQGDSGGPMHVVSGSKLTQAGIVSWGIGCGGANRPGVYTKVSAYTNWIKRNTADSCSC